MMEGMIWGRKEKGKEDEGGVDGMAWEEKGRGREGKGKEINTKGRGGMIWRRLRGRKRRQGGMA